MRSLSVALSTSLLLASTVLAGPNYAPGSLDRYFRIEYQAASTARGNVLEGFVYNEAALLADRMRLSIEALDASGRVVGTTTTWVLGGVPPNNRAWFQAPVPPAAMYRVEILSFDWVGRGGGGQ
ncbi:MAG TPA: FxLYD domain-containing protein [Methylomirabilota bacterium]